MNFLWHIIALIAMTIPYALGYNLVFGKGKIFHFGPVGVNVLIAYAMFLTLRGTESYAIALLIGAMATVVVSLFFSWLSLRLDPDGFGVMSIAVHLAILAVILNWSSLTRGALGVPQIPRLPFMESLASFALVTVMVALLWIVFIRWIDRSAFGRQLSALAEHQWHARSLGIPRERIHHIAFLIAGLGGFISVFFWAPYLRLLHPNDYNFPSFVFLVMIVVAGKPGSVWGVTLSVILLTFLKEGLRFVPLAPDMVGPVRLILFGLILFAAVWIRRDTLFPKQRSV